MSRLLFFRFLFNIYFGRCLHIILSRWFTIFFRRRLRILSFRWCSIFLSSWSHGFLCGWLIFLYYSWLHVIFWRQLHILCHRWQLRFLALRLLISFWLASHQLPNLRVTTFPTFWQPHTILNTFLLATTLLGSYLHVSLPSHVLLPINTTVATTTTTTATINTRCLDPLLHAATCHVTCFLSDVITSFWAITTWHCHVRNAGPHVWVGLGALGLRLTFTRGIWLLIFVWCGLCGGHWALFCGLLSRRVGLLWGGNVGCGLVVDGGNRRVKKWVGFG